MCDNQDDLMFKPKDPINLDQINADQINADPINADQINADQINADQINADQINADPINADPVNAQQPNVQLLNAQPEEMSVTEKLLQNKQPEEMSVTEKLLQNEPLLNAQPKEMTAAQKRAQEKQRQIEQRKQKQINAAKDAKFDEGINSKSDSCGSNKRKEKLTNGHKLLGTKIGVTEQSYAIAVAVRELDSEVLTNQDANAKWIINHLKSTAQNEHNNLYLSVKEKKKANEPLSPEERDLRPDTPHILRLIMHLLKTDEEKVNILSDDVKKRAECYTTLMAPYLDHKFDPNQLSSTSIEKNYHSLRTTIDPVISIAELLETDPETKKHIDSKLLDKFNMVFEVCDPLIQGADATILVHGVKDSGSAKYAKWKEPLTNAQKAELAENNEEYLQRRRDANDAYHEKLEDYNEVYNPKQSERVKQREQQKQQIIAAKDAKFDEGINSKPDSCGSNKRKEKLTNGHKLLGTKIGVTEQSYAIAVAARELDSEILTNQDANEKWIVNHIESTPQNEHLNLLASAKKNKKANKPLSQAERDLRPDTPRILRLIMHLLKTDEEKANVLSDDVKKRADCYTTLMAPYLDHKFDPNQLSSTSIEKNYRSLRTAIDPVVSIAELLETDPETKKHIDPKLLEQFNMVFEVCYPLIQGADATILVHGVRDDGSARYPNWEEPLTDAQKAELAESKERYLKKRRDANDAYHEKLEDYNEMYNPKQSERVKQREQQKQ